MEDSSFLIELSGRQSARTIEQAIRYGCDVALEPRTWDPDGVLEGRIDGATQRGLRVELAGGDNRAIHGLLGVYCDGSLILGEHRYLFTSPVIELPEDSGSSQLIVERPGVLLVCQRRKYARAQLAESSSVRLFWGEHARARAKVCNVSVGGLACRCDQDVADALVVGEPVRVEFRLPGCQTPFTFAATIRSKTPGSNRGVLIVGMQFDVPLGDAEGEGSRQELQDYLVWRKGGASAEDHAVAGTMAGRWE